MITPFTQLNLGGVEHVWIEYHVAESGTASVAESDGRCADLAVPERNPYLVTTVPITALTFSTKVSQKSKNLLLNINIFLYTNTKILTHAQKHSNIEFYFWTYKLI
jgi:hypothetical protein